MLFYIWVVTNISLHFFVVVVVAVLLRFCFFAVCLYLGTVWTSIIIVFGCSNRPEEKKGWKIASKFFSLLPLFFFRMSH